MNERMTPEYRALNEQMHEERQFDGDDPKRYIPKIEAFIADIEAESVLDYGCGQCVLKLKNELSVPVYGYDPCREGFTDEPDAHDMLVSFDVMEHVEPELVDNVLDHVRSKVKKGALIVIALELDKYKRLADGSNPHRSIKTADEWRELLLKRFRKVLIAGTTGRPWEVAFWCLP